ncbi:unnamed protein product [Mytilus edulis]|uniref:DZIP3-like HEPN domain-containing protein n=1 Tax=Mytilus edulis TaxID=6550 RepID=A0A8S3PQN9_MYTED|nr:unnamed protein product [Mytilus edulis]
MVTPDQIRYTRCRLILGDVLAQIMRDYMEQSGTQPIAIERSILRNLRFRERLNQKEMSVIQTLPADGFKQFDISLMYKIARNKSFALLISDKPTRGWGASPQYNEGTAGDNMERIRICRDDLSHIAGSSIAEDYFNDLFSKFIDIAQRAEQHLQPKQFEHQILKYKTCTLDKEMEESYTHQINVLKRKLFETQVKPDFLVKVYIDQSTQTAIEDMRDKGPTEEIDVCLLQDGCLLNKEIESFIQNVFEVADLQCYLKEQCIVIFAFLEENCESASDEDSSSEDEPLKDLVLNVGIEKKALVSEDALSHCVRDFLGMWYLG